MFGYPIIAPPAPRGNRSNCNPGSPEEVIFLEPVGSLVIDESRPRTTRMDVIRCVGKEIAKTRKDTPGLRLARRAESYRGLA